MITLSLEKETVVLGKSLEKVLIFGSKKPVMNPDFKSDVLAAITIVYAKAPSYGWMGVCSINHVKMPYSNVPANKLYDTGIRSVLEINNQ